MPKAQEVWVRIPASTGPRMRRGEAFFNLFTAPLIEAIALQELHSTRRTEATNATDPVGITTEDTGPA